MLICVLCYWFVVWEDGGGEGREGKGRLNGWMDEWMDGCVSKIMPRGFRGT